MSVKTLPDGNFIGVVNASYIGDLQALGDQPNEQQVARIYFKSQAVCPNFPGIGSMHDAWTWLRGAEPKLVYQVDFLEQTLGGKEIQTYLYRPVHRKLIAFFPGTSIVGGLRKIVARAINAITGKKPDPAAKHIAIMLDKISGDAYILTGSKFEGAIIERGSDYDTNGAVNILSRHFSNGDSVPYMAGADFVPNETGGSTMAPTRIFDGANAELKILGRIIDGDKSVTHCQKIGVAQRVGLAEKSGYGCSASAADLLGHGDTSKTACGEAPKAAVTTTLTIGGKQMAGVPIASASRRAFVINPFFGLFNQGKAR